MTPSGLYPEIEPYRTGSLELDSLHHMHWEESGNALGIPVVFLHGGPGAGGSPQHRRFFNANDYRIIVYDQRGAGRSSPLGEIRDNTTAHLIDDLESLRRHLDVDSWLLFGGSWGSTLALAYAEAHPERCMGLVLRGIFLCTEHEIDWFMRGMGRFFTEHWQRFSGFLPPAERASLLENYHARLVDPDPEVHLPAARAWSIYEGACSTLLPNEGVMAHFGDDRVALGLARIEAHYFLNRGFMREDALLKECGALHSIPGIIIQGRYDMVCPFETAYQLHEAWPQAKFRVIPGAGHSAWEPGILTSLIEATRQFTRSGNFSG